MDKEFLEGLRVGEDALPQELVEKIWQAHQQQLQQVRFDSMLADAIRRAGGRNATAITALLDMPALQQSADPKAAMDKALRQLQQDSGYLFESSTPPPYARGTGAQDFRQEEPMSLAEALRERFSQTNR